MGKHIGYIDQLLTCCFGYGDIPSIRLKSLQRGKSFMTTSGAGEVITDDVSSI